ncbi:MAG: excinuclease ABC subunit UvrA [Flavobacteriaceae bacterium]|nr:excinuclease ABC subunit UvrA [Flavobacteriaceae bacterium]
MTNRNIELRLKKENKIRVKGARMHNLKNVTVDIPSKKLVVFTGLSGSGKSSLAFDTLYAEGQRRYVESLSSYARQFLGRLDKPKVDKIEGLAPAIAIEQKVNSTNPRSTVGTTTEIYDYLKLLFARIGTTYSPISNEAVTKDSVSDILDQIKSYEEGTKLIVLAPIHLDQNRSLDQILNLFAQQGYARIQVNGEIVRISEVKDNLSSDCHLVVDRVILKKDEDALSRLADSLETAFFEGKGEIQLFFPNDNKTLHFSNQFARDGINFIEPSSHLFSFNNPLGACPDCEGYGDLIGIDHDLVIPNTGLSIFEDAVAPWRSSSASRYKKKLIETASLFDFPIHKPYFQLSEKHKEVIWEGNKHFKGIHAFFQRLEKKNYKIQNRVMLSRYRGRTTCTSCRGKRLRKETQYVKINGKSINDLVDMPVDELLQFMQTLQLSAHDHQVAERLLIEINNRLEFLCEVGLPYLSLNRKSNSLSGGESQRINLATSLGSSLVGSMYILDEPSIGLHPKDTERLICILEKLRDLGNTVIVVEHDEDIICAADEIIDLGPEAGAFGGEIVAQGTLNTILKSNGLTAAYLNGTQRISTKIKPIQSTKSIVLSGARENNLKNIDVRFPLHCITAVTGVSGSGKSTLVKGILWPALLREKGVFTEKAGQHSDISGDLDEISVVEYISQNPIGTSTRSNPVTYIKAYDDIRKLFAVQQASKLSGYSAKHFSFNVDGGRCESCKGEGEITVEMQFMADVKLRCDSCEGKRFKREVLEVRFAEKNIFDVLSMSVDEALVFFTQHQETKIANKIKALADVGMGYVALGQSSSTLSGGEAQRIKLASYLTKDNSKEKILFLFDEPTTGLHFHDIGKLLQSFRQLIDRGHTIIVIEHNTHLIEYVDHVIDLGPTGGHGGGKLLASGKPEDIAKNKKSSLYKRLFANSI